MFALVKLYFVCPMSSIHKTDQGMACTKFKDGLYYDIDVVTTHGSFAVLEKLKNSLCSHSPRVALSRCDVDPSIQHEPQEFELGTIKHEMIKQEICTEEELASTSTNGHLEFDTFMGSSSLNEPTPKEIHFVDHLSSSVVAQELVVVDDIFSENTHRNILHDHCYMLQSGTSGGKIDSRVAPNNPALHEGGLDEHQTVVEETESEQGSSERFPVYIMHQDGAEVGMDWHSRSVPTPTSEILNSDLDFNNVIEEEIVVKTEETDEVIIPTNESDVNNQDFDCMPIKKEEIVEENFSEELTSADSAQSYGEGSSCEVENQNRMSGISMKRHFCVYCKKLYSHLPRHLERIHHDEEAVKQFSSLPRDSVQSYGEAASCEVENQNRVSIAKNKRYFCVYCKELYTNLPRHLERIHHDEEAVKQFHCLPKERNIPGSAESNEVRRERKKFTKLDRPDCLKNRVRRGRKMGQTFRRKIYLMRLAHADFLPTRNEQRYLQRRGLGQCKPMITIDRKWSCDRIKQHIINMFPNNIQDLLRMSGFKLGRCNRKKQLSLLELSDTYNAFELEDKLANAMLIVIPNHDLPSNLPTINIEPNKPEDETSSGSDSDDSDSAAPVPERPSVEAAKPYVAPRETLQPSYPALNEMDMPDFTENSCADNNIRRGRKMGQTFKKKVYLTKLAHPDFLPAKYEHKYLQRRGLGQCKHTISINRKWPYDRIKRHLINMFPNSIQDLLRMFDFKLARCDKKKRVYPLELTDTPNGFELEDKLANGMLIMIPNCDFPSNLPVIKIEPNKPEGEASSVFDPNVSDSTAAVLEIPQIKAERLSVSPSDMSELLHTTLNDIEDDMKPDIFSTVNTNEDVNLSYVKPENVDESVFEMYRQYEGMTCHSQATETPEFAEDIV